MRIIHAHVYQSDGSFKEAEINIEQDRIVEHAQGAQEEIDAYDLYAVPGAVNMRYGVSFDNPLRHAENYGIDKASKEQLSQGIVAFVPTTRLPKEHAEKVARVVAEWNSKEAFRHPDCADVVGLLLDKPLQHIELAKPSEESWEDLAIDDAHEFSELEEGSKALFKVITLNPNKAGVEAYIKHVKSEAALAIADVEPSFANAEKVIKAGASVVTRSWSKQFVASEEKRSVVDALIQNEQVKLELVASEKTAPARDVVATFARFQGRIALTSWNNNVFDAAKRAIEMGVPAPLAIDAATIVPATILGIERDYGSLEVGKRANVVLVDRKGQIKHIIHNGTIVL